MTAIPDRPAQPDPVLREAEGRAPAPRRRPRVKLTLRSGALPPFHAWRP